ncbi:MFS transporter [Paraburkholderia sp. BCC1886]|uniref:MFS transporter n=1 Tax=Paraburkholderia sp. BCC1886 TaxID=2562670 RepID=UPI0021B46346|nr:MFS transporter [Paraburkholderia sp. BCC1886]
MNDSQIEHAVMRKVIRRFVPLLFICFVVAFLDRVNVGFAALTMNHDIGLSASTFGLGAGLFFVSYFLLEIPSNLILERVGARRWIARIMITWGVLSACTALVQGPHSFYVIRLLLGAAEAGFSPGVTFFFTLWIPSRYRAGVIATYLAAMPVASVIGSPLASACLSLEGVLGLHGWQWMFLINALPALLLAPVVYFMLSDHPCQAGWLNEEEKNWLENALRADRSLVQVDAHDGILRFLLKPKVIILSIAYFGTVGFNYGLSFFLPQIIHQFGLSLFATGLVNVIPFALAVVGMRFLARSSDARGERKYHLVLAIVLAALALGLSTGPFTATARFALLCLAAIGAFSALVVFWAHCSDFLDATGMAAGMAMINSVGNLSGFAYLYMVGFVKEVTGSFAGGLRIISAVGALAAVLILIGSNPQRSRAVEKPAV